VVYILTCFKPR